MKIRVFILTRAVTLNPADAAVLNALKQMGHSSVQSVRLGRCFEIEFDDSLPPEVRLRQVEEAFHRPESAFPNPITETFRLEVVSSP